MLPAKLLSVKCNFAATTFNGMLLGTSLNTIRNKRKPFNLWVWVCHSTDYRVCSYFKTSKSINWFDHFGENSDCWVFRQINSSADLSFIEKFRLFGIQRNEFINWFESMRRIGIQTIDFVDWSEHFEKKITILTISL